MICAKIESSSDTWRTGPTGPTGADRAASCDNPTMCFTNRYVTPTHIGSSAQPKWLAREKASPEADFSSGTTVTETGPKALDCFLTACWAIKKPLSQSVLLKSFTGNMPIHLIRHASCIMDQRRNRTVALPCNLLSLSN